MFGEGDVLVVDDDPLTVSSSDDPDSESAMKRRRDRDGREVTRGGGGEDKKYMKVQIVRKNSTRERMVREALERIYKMSYVMLKRRERVLGH